MGLHVCTLALILVICAMNGQFVSATAQVPVREGIVTDSAGLLTSSEIKVLERELNQSTIKLNVLTATRITETEAENLAKEAYQNWELSENEVSVVITTSPNYIFAYYDNGDLKQAVNRAKTKNIKGLIDNSFIPEAKSGHIKDGILALSQAFNKLHMGEKQEINKLPIFFTLFVIVIVGGLIFGTLINIKQKRAIEQIKEAKNTLDTVFSELLKLSDVVVIKDYKKGLVTGETEKLLKIVDDDMAYIRNKVIQTSDELKAYTVSWFGSESALRKAQKANDLALDSKTKMSHLQNRVQKVEDSRVGIAQKIKENNEKVSIFQEKIIKLQETTTYPLETMIQRINDAKDYIAKADESNDFDLVDAQNKMDEANRIMDELDMDIDKLREQFGEFTNLPKTILTAELHVREIVSSEGLLLVDFDPYKNFTKAHELFEKVAQYVRSGETMKAIKKMDMLNKMLLEAVKITEKTVDLKRGTQNKIVLMKNKVEIFTSKNELVESEIQKIKREFDTPHFSDIQALFIQTKENIQNISQKIVNIETLNDQTVQQYQQAAKESEQLCTVIETVETLQNKILGRYNELKQKQVKLQTQFAEVTKSYQSTAETMDRSGIRKSNEFLSLISDINNEMNKTSQMLHTIPADLHVYEKQVSLLQRNVSSLTVQVENMISQKRQAERRLQEVKSEFETSKRRYGSKVNASRYNNQYNASMSEVDRLIAAGMFVQAMSLMNQTESYAQEMQREHDHIVSEERRQEQNTSYTGRGDWESSDNSSTSDSGGSDW